jgi:ring-1,2-phenylacetyl-CoA epoxidase subunit PaaA
MKARISAWEEGEWVRDAAMAHAEKQKERKEKQAV